jgi:hypothetical protein
MPDHAWTWHCAEKFWHSSCAYVTSWSFVSTLALHGDSATEPKPAVILQAHIQRDGSDQMIERIPAFSLLRSWANA